MTDPNLYRRAGTANRTITDAPQVPSQDVSRFKAVDTSPDCWGEKPPARVGDRGRKLRRRSA